MVQKNNQKSFDTTAPLPEPPLLLLRNVISSILNLINLEKSFLSFLHNHHNLLETFRFIFITIYLFFIRFVPSFFLRSLYRYDTVKATKPYKYLYDTRAPQNDTGVGRMLSQLLTILNDVPVSSRKYELVRSSAERIIRDNHEEGVHALREVNRVVLSAAFARALGQLEKEAMERVEGERVEGDYQYYLRRVVRAVGWRGRGGEGRLSGVEAEKLAAELMWVAEKLAECGCGEEASRRWAGAGNLGCIALTADPRLQTSLLKLSAFLFKEAKDMGLYEIEESKKKEYMQVKLKMLQSWLPLLCRASNGTDVPALSIRERAELEKVLEDIIERLEQDEQEQVLSLWLHHFTLSPSSDWPNLHACFARWCTASRKQLI
ncbi:hypothetical protein TanjilG_14876 [Lupinus angustifolius]|uniref:Uncharacterized protein n=1 Tax=Lupinus angustifolius TaxID=3871 RepID=A0A1J7G763_LUPAN|nr:PREDICTED: uncharacterized protein LOC109329667 [Lupinus angustifolius]OIV96199.1 hypothetical protein TanjilG_14876 [Lupinus angustifolius]